MPKNKFIVGEIVRWKNYAGVGKVISYAHDSIRGTYEYLVEDIAINNKRYFLEHDLELQKPYKFNIGDKVLVKGISGIYTIVSRERATIVNSNKYDVTNKNINFSVTHAEDNLVAYNPTSSLNFEVGDKVLGKGEQESIEHHFSRNCQHEWVNVGFTSIKLVCKHCDKEKGGDDA